LDIEGVLFFVCVLEKEKKGKRTLDFFGEFLNKKSKKNKARKKM
jgi:predicted neutral ceramidase superfamily lipid hydrolase